MELSGTQPTPNTAGNREQFLDQPTPIGLPWRLTIFSLFIFALSVFGFLGLHFGYRTYLAGQSDNLDAELAKLANQVSSDEQEQFVSFYSQILNLKSVLEKHAFSANAFGFLEKNVVPGLYFTNAEIDMKTYSVTLDGTSPTFESVAQQIAVFDKAPEVGNASLDTVAIASGNVLFSVSITFKPDMFARQMP